MDEPTVPDFVAALDQIAAHLLDMAKALARYYHALLAEGVPPEYASSLVVAMQTTLVGGTTAGES